MRSKEQQTLRRVEQYLGLKKLRAGGMMYSTVQLGRINVNGFRLITDQLYYVRLLNRQ